MWLFGFRAIEEWILYKIESIVHDEGNNFYLY